MAEVIIAGGGIGGLATALAVAARGHHAVVLERADEFTEIGAGIQLAPNGLHALDVLGVGAAVRAAAVRMAELRFMDGVTGAHVASLPLTEQYRRRFAGPYVVVHRAELHRALLDACLAADAVSLYAGAHVVDYTRDATSATALLADGTGITGDVLIGADGIHSAIRARLVGDGEPRISGISVYRAVIPMERVPDALRFDRSVVWWAGPGCHFVHYPIAGGRFLNLAASRADGGTEAVSGECVHRDRVLRELAALGGTAQRLLELGADWKTWMLVDRDPVSRWTDGRVALLGDAAHPMLHYAAQGACQALEDAVVLGARLAGARADELPQRLTGYRDARHERTTRITLAARDSVRLWHPEGAAAETRNALLGAMSADRLHDHVAWMHGFRVGGPRAEEAAA